MRVLTAATCLDVGFDQPVFEPGPAGVVQVFHPGARGGLVVVRNPPCSGATTATLLLDGERNARVQRACPQGQLTRPGAAVNADLGRVDAKLVLHLLQTIDEATDAPRPRAVVTHLRVAVTRCGPEIGVHLVVTVGFERVPGGTLSSNLVGAERHIGAAADHAGRTIYTDRYTLTRAGDVRG